MATRFSQVTARCAPRTYPSWPAIVILSIVDFIAHGAHHAFFSLTGSRFAMHRRIARFTFPIWLYVSVTGVIVYLMLYQFSAS